MPNSSSEIERVSVRLINIKNRIYADLASNEFTCLLDRLVEIYQNSSSTIDGIDEMDAILYSNQWNWKKGAPGRKSNIFTTAL